jgi:spermidine synthase
MQEKPSFLYLGLGGGSLSAFIHHYFQDSQHVAVELDEAVVAATESIGLKDYIYIQVGDALNFQRSPSQEPFDCIFVDIFDGDNLLPCKFYSEQFVTRMRDDLLTPSGVVVHNFHTGNPKLASQLAEAKNVFARSFESCYEVDSLDSKANAGNTILVGSKVAPCRSKAVGDVLSGAAVKSQEKLGFPIDAASILADARLVVALT